MIKAIFFDLDGTIRQNDPRGDEVFARRATELGLRVRSDDVLRAMRWADYYWARSREYMEDEARLGRMTEDFWRHYAHRQLVALGASETQAQALAAPLHTYMSESYKPANIVPVELPGVLQTLRKAGYPLAVLSNRSKPFQDEVDALGLGAYFEFTLDSGSVKSWKPDPGIFLDACKRIGVEPHEAAYIGDNWFADIVGARAAGLFPVLYDPAGIFDDPDCDVIRAFTELPPLLQLLVFR